MLSTLGYCFVLSRSFDLFREFVTSVWGVSDLGDCSLSVGPVCLDSIRGIRVKSLGCVG